MQDIPLKIRHFERVLSKHLKKLAFLFLSDLVLFKRQDYRKQKGRGTSDQSLFRLQNKFRKIPILVMYYVTKFDKAVFPNVTSANLCKPIHNVINYFTFI